jgi:glyoxylase-like metal-dependent hydrolase (beta-lactamase superfamily II)
MGLLFLAATMVSGSSPTQAETGWRLTSVLLLDQPAKGLAYGLDGRDEAAPTSTFQTRIPLTRQRIEAAGIDPKEVRYVLLSHSHGDHAGAAYLWRTQGARIVAPATAAFTVTCLMPTWSDYSIWVPAPIDRPLPLKRAGDETEIELCGLRIKAIFVPGHSFDSVIYTMELNGKRIVFTGDISFEGGSHILHRCWGDREKAAAVAKIVRTKVLSLKPDHVLTGHRPRPKGTAFLEDLLKRTESALTDSSGK